MAGALGDFEPGPDHPLLDSLEVEGNSARGTRVLTTARDGWIEDHAIEGTPVLPGVVGIELMAAVSKALFPGQSFAGATEVKFDAPAKVYRDDPTTLLVEAHRIAPGRARARLVSSRVLRTGRVQQTEHFSANLVFGEVAAVDALPAAFLPDEPVDAAGIYRRFFHGPGFRVLTRIVGVSADGLQADGTTLELRSDSADRRPGGRGCVPGRGHAPNDRPPPDGIAPSGEGAAGAPPGHGRSAPIRRCPPDRRRLRHRHRWRGRARAPRPRLHHDRPWASSARRSVSGSPATSSHQLPGRRPWPRAVIGRARDRRGQRR